ncbi:MAG: AAA family ATPase [Ectothiorhodospiraceae bacterium]|nr:AAA family ATPase [Ectothiorhodospiraceae bacterium]
MELDELQLRELGLDRQPFDEHTSLQDPDIEARVGTILQLLQTGNRIVLVTGPIGVGVSQLLQNVEHSAGGVLRFLSLDGEDRLTPDDIAHACLEAFDLPPAPVTSGPRLLAYIADRLEGLVQAGERPTLVVDNAHDLSTDAMDALLELQGIRPEGQTRSGPSLLLAGAPELENALQETMRENDRGWVFQLEPWTVDQVAAYIDTGLERAGDTDGRVTRLLDPEEIHALSGGYPAQVRAACIQALSSPRSHRATRPAGGLLSALPAIRLPAFDLTGARLPAAVFNARNGFVAGAAVVVLLLLVVLLRPSGDDTLPEEDLVVPPRPTSVETEQRAERAPEQEEEATTSLDLSIGRDLQAGPSLDDDGHIAEAPPSETEPATAPEPELAEDDAQEEQQSTLEEEPEIERPQVRAEEDVQTDEPAAPDTEEETATASVEASEDDAWLESRSPERYTIQLVAAHNPQPLAEFVSSQANSLETRVVTTRRDGRDWYVVVTGDYAGRDQAREALEGLPSELRQQGAWVRTFDSLLQARQ